jgi:CheY-like chemotaxis protein
MARILVIDEDAPLRTNVRRLLALEGYEVNEANGGLQGVELALAVRPDLVLCDLVMPDIDGIEVIRRLRADARTAAVPVVVVSGSKSVLGTDADVIPGVQGYVTKPFEIDHLLEVVSRVLAAARES